MSFRLISRTLGRGLLSRPVRVITGLPINIRFNSNLSTPQKIPIEINKNLNLEEDVDEWLTAIDNLRTEFISTGQPFNPEKQLAPPGETHIDIESHSFNEFQPTEQQLEEIEALKDKPIPVMKDEVLEHCTNLLMSHGKKATAEKLLGRALYIMKLQLRVDPVEALKEILEKMSPLMVTKSFKNRTAKALIIPVPLKKRQRFRIAFGWIVTRASERNSRSFSVNLANELIEAYKGNSKGFEYRSEMHKEAMQFRAYLKH